MNFTSNISSLTLFTLIYFNQVKNYLACSLCVNDFFFSFSFIFYLLTCILCSSSSYQNAAYLADKQGLSVIDAVIGALSKAGYDKPGSQKVYIQSTNSSVLLKFKEKTSYELVYKIDETIGDAANAAVEDIKSFASSVVVNKDSIIPNNDQFLTAYTNIVPKLKNANLSVFVETFSNEFVSQAWDFFSDATVEINTYITGAQIDGIITDFPKTADRYRSKC